MLGHSLFGVSWDEKRFVRENDWVVAAELCAALAHAAWNGWGELEVPESGARSGGRDSGRERRARFTQSDPSCRSNGDAPRCCSLGQT
jgi:hypothetical protein